MTFSRLYQVRMKPKRHNFCFLIKFLFCLFFSCARSRGGVPPLHAAVPRGAAPRGAPPSRAPTSRGRGVQRARGAPPAAGYRPAPPIVQETYGEYVSTSAPLMLRSHAHLFTAALTPHVVNTGHALVKLLIRAASIFAERKQRSRVSETVTVLPTLETPLTPLGPHSSSWLFPDVNHKNNQTKYYYHYKYDHVTMLTK